MDSFYLLFYLLLLLWAIHILQRIFYSVYFWQLKEYRFERIKGDPIRARNIFFPKTALLIAIILLFPSVFLTFFLWAAAVLAAFYLFGIYSLYLLLRKKWRFPKLTNKSIVLLLLTIAVLLCFLVVFFQYFLFFIVTLEIALPFLTFLLMELFQIPTNFWKKLTYRKAGEKIKNRKNLLVIGITGSYGKSSTKEFLYVLLSQKYNVLRTSGNVNTEIGVAQTVINHLKPEHQIFIVEMGAYKKGEVKLLCDIVRPKIGVVTGVNEQHIALFGSLDNLLSAEGGGELAKALPKDGLLVLNGDNKYCLALYKKTDSLAGERKKVYSVTGNKVKSDVWTEDVSAHETFISFLAIDKDKNVAHFRVNVLGRQNVQNILAAILVAKELGMSLEEIAEACKNIKQEQAGMTLKKGKHGMNIIDSSYSANPDGVYADIDYLNVFLQKKVIVMPCLIELGEKSKEVHERIGKKISEICDLAIITSKDRFKDIKGGATESGMEEKNILFCENPNDIYSIITLFCKKGDAVLLEGRVPARLISLLSH